MLSYDYSIKLPNIDILKNEKLLQSRVDYTKKQLFLIRTPFFDPYPILVHLTKNV